MASSAFLTLVNGTVSATGGQSVFASPTRGVKPIMRYQVSVAGTTVTFQLQHSATGVATEFANLNSVTSTLTATGQTLSHQITSNNYNSLLPYVRLNITAITGSFTLVAQLHYELF